MHGPVSPPQPRRHTEVQLEPRDLAQTHRQAVTARQTQPGQQDVLVFTDVVTVPDDADEEVRPEELAEAAFGASERQRRVKVERRRPVHVSVSEGSVRLWADAAHLEPSNVQQSAQEEAVTDVARFSGYIASM